MISYSLGNKWDQIFLDHIIELNSVHKNHGTMVTELYGSLHSKLTGIPSARPDYRLPDLDFNYMENFITKAHSANIRINYTINAPLIQSIETVYNKRKQIWHTIKILTDLGVDTFTLANSLMFEIVRDATHANLEVSSILPKRSVSQLNIYKSWGATTICMDVARNRDVSFLKSYIKSACSLGLKVKLLVNEYCSIGGSPCNGLYQTDCVLHSALGGNPKKYFSGWPFSRCSMSRNKSYSSLLKSGFILPQWVEGYRDNVGVSCFKITGRTCDSEWLLAVVKAYLRKEYQGDIRKLWVDPGGDSYNRYEKESNYLSASYLQDCNFIDHWWNNHELRCDNQCGFTCTYCDDVAQSWFEKT